MKDSNSNNAKMNNILCRIVHARVNKYAHYSHLHTHTNKHPVKMCIIDKQLQVRTGTFECVKIKYIHLKRSTGHKFSKMLHSVLYTYKIIANIRLIPTYQVIFWHGLQLWRGARLILLPQTLGRWHYLKFKQIFGMMNTYDAKPSQNTRGRQRLLTCVGFSIACKLLTFELMLCGIAGTLAIKGWPLCVCKDRTPRLCSTDDIVLKTSE